MTNNGKALSRKPFNCADQATLTWLQRADMCADLLASIAPGLGTLSLADVGCGDQKLRDSLSAHGLPFVYSGYDLLPQTPDIRRFDVRHDVLPRGHDVVVMLGVIEYLSGLSNAIGRLARRAPHLVLSHVIRNGDTYSKDKLAELGWINHLTTEELENVLARCGYSITARRLTPDGRTVLVACASRVHAERE